MGLGSRPDSEQDEDTSVSKLGWLAPSGDELERWAVDTRAVPADAAGPRQAPRWVLGVVAASVIALVAIWLYVEERNATGRRAASIFEAQVQADGRTIRLFLGGCGAEVTRVDAA